jgi:hypothetical protein
VNLRKAYTGDERPLTVEVQYPLRKTCGRSEGRWGEKERVLLPGDGPLGWELCNYGTRFPNRRRDADCMSQGSTDEAVVAVKPAAEEGMVTCLRIKLPESDRDVGGEGRNMASSSREPEYTML